ncbi:MAG: haloacid dehalogenase-like hydrolase [Chlamydiia bacterium]|nr:haloacid dehalogenase-like hydrolase [Chlamydiia bacterium]
MTIGIDFDNTIVCYDDAFYQAARERELVPETIPHSKNGVRDYLRQQKQETSWTELQGYIYGQRMNLASAFPGVDRFLQLSQSKNTPIYVISHKTKHPFLGPAYDLHAAAMQWFQSQDFPWKPPAFFELTLEEKLQRIRTQKCAVFIDDLPEVLQHPQFPDNVRKILFDPHKVHHTELETASSWDEITQILYGS